MYRLYDIQWQEDIPVEGTKSRGRKVSSVKGSGREVD